MPLSLYLFLSFEGGYYTIEQTKSRLRIIVLNTNFMRHDFKYSQSHSSAIRQRPDGSIVLPSGVGQQQYNMGYHRKHYHHDNDEHHNNNNYNRYNKEKYYSSQYNGEANSQNGADSSGGIVSALSVSHESEKQWEWLEEVLIKSSRNKETVSK
jgi:sphingomyelin phosphodiesterase acid-like 3